MPLPKRNNLHAHAVIAVALILVGCGLAWWSITSGRITPGTLTIRSLAAIGTLTLADWIRDLARSIWHARRH